MSHEQDITVAKYWAENLLNLQQMLEQGTVYVDFVMRGSSQRYDIMISSFPFDNSSVEGFSEWKLNAICTFRVNFQDQKRASIWSMWEVHTIAAILTVSGYEVMMGNKVRRTGRGAQSAYVKAGTTDMLSKSFTQFKKEHSEKMPKEPDYTPYSDALTSKATSFNLYGELPQTGETVNSIGDVPAERQIRDTSNESLLEEGMF